MGIDIYSHIEFLENSANGERCFAHFATVTLPRDSVLFYLMVGIAFDTNRMTGLEPVSQPRGLPKDASYAMKEAYCVKVNDAAARVDDTLYVTQAEAEEWIAEGRSRWIDDRALWLANPNYHSASWLSGKELEEVQRRYAASEGALSWGYQFPDREIPSDATLVKKNAGWQIGAEPGQWTYVERGERTARGRHLLLSAVISAMHVLDAESPNQSRFVFWFDQ